MHFQCWENKGERSCSLKIILYSCDDHYYCIRYTWYWGPPVHIYCCKDIANYWCNDSLLFIYFTFSEFSDLIRILSVFVIIMIIFSSLYIHWNYFFNVFFSQPGYTFMCSWTPRKRATRNSHRLGLNFHGIIPLVYLIFPWYHLLGYICWLAYNI